MTKPTWKIIHGLAAISSIVFWLVVFVESREVMENLENESLQVLTIGAFLLLMLLNKAILEHTQEKCGLAEDIRRLENELGIPHKPLD